MKYTVLKNETKLIGGKALFRIQRVADGEKGGYLESEENLSQEGSCWIHGESVVYEMASVSDDAQVFGEVFGRAKISGRAKVYGRVFDDAQVMDDAEVYGQAYGLAVIKDGAKVYGNIGGSASVGGDAVMLGHIP